MCGDWSSGVDEEQPATVAAKKNNNQSINVYSFHQPYLIFQEKKAYSVATLYQNISKVTDYYISVEKISNRNCLEEELLEVLPKAKGAVASNVEGVEPGSC